MTTLADKAILSGADNRPPMLEKDMYDSWKSRMELYMMNRQHGRMILESVENGPLIWPSIEENGVTRPKKYSELSATEAIQADCDIKATNIILQGLPPEVYALVSNHKVAKELWARIQLLMQGTSLTKQERECKLYDEFDKFAYKKGETLREFYLRFSLLLNDMNIYNMKLEQFQVNTKFLNTLPPEWSKFVTDVKLVRDLHTTNVDQLHAYLGQHEFHANEVRLMHERNSDPLALVATHQMTQSPYQTHQNSYQNTQFQPQVSPYQSPQSTETSDGLAAIQAQLNNLGREIKKVNEKLYAAQFGGPFQGGGYRAIAPGYYQRNNANPSFQERRQSMEETLSKFMSESAKRHEENSNLIKEIRASTHFAIRNQGASIKTLEIQIGQRSKVLQERGFRSLLSSTKTNPRNQVKSISTTSEADSNLIRRIGSTQYAVSTGQSRIIFYKPRQTTVPFPGRLEDHYSEEEGNYEPKFTETYRALLINNTIPRKEKDIGSFTLPYFINDFCFDNALVDLGASISVMPLSTYLNLGLGELAHTRLMVELADRTVKFDNIQKEIDETPFLSTARIAKIDVYKRNITLRVREEKIIFKRVKPTSSFGKDMDVIVMKEWAMLFLAEFLREVSEKDKRNGISHAYQKLKGFYKGVLNLGPDYIKDAKMCVCVASAALLEWELLGELLVKDSKRHAFWSLNEDILKITVLKTNTPYPSRRYGVSVPALTKRPHKFKDQYAVSRGFNTPYSRYGINIILWKISNVVPTPRNPQYAVSNSLDTPYSTDFQTL
ncbi:hypothetical protein Tco_0801710 [Tanacetum coccineum]|uniref:Reverse transcriptase domain-containing protein n=1 Tax=Tanacetum coccineum TaxID=301880 RepID=A0ABQ4ZXJ8_9ASTR